MRFTTSSLVLTLFAIFSATSTTTTTASPIANNDDILLSRRHLYQRDGVDSQLTDTAIDYNSIPSSQLHRSPSSGGARMINKRQKPRRLAGDKRGTTGGGFLDNVVNDFAPPKPLTDESSFKGETMTKRVDDDDSSEQEAEAGQLQQEREAITTEGDDGDEEDEDEEHTSGSEEPLPDDITNPSPSSIVEPTDSGSDPEPLTTTSSEEQEPSPASEDEDKDDSGNEEEPTLTPLRDDDTTISTEESEATTATTDTPEDTTADLAPEPTDAAVVITSTSSSSTTVTRKSGQTDPTVTKASKDEEVGPTTLPEHKEETNSNAMALTVGAVVAAVLITSVIGIWIFRKWKLTPSRQFKSKFAGGPAGGVGAAMVYGSGKGHDDRSEYNSYDEIIRPEAYEIEPSPTPMTPVSPAPAYPTAAAIGSEYEYGYAHYEQQQQLQQQQTMGYDSGYQQPSYHFGYNSGVVPAMSEASTMRDSAMTTSKANPNVIGGVPAMGHNIHGYGSEDYTQNDHFLRELRE